MLRSLKKTRGSLLRSCTDCTQLGAFLDTFRGALAYIYRCRLSRAAEARYFIMDTSFVWVDYDGEDYQVAAPLDKFMFSIFQTAFDKLVDKTGSPIISTFELVTSDNGIRVDLKSPISEAALARSYTLRLRARPPVESSNDVPELRSGLSALHVSVPAVSGTESVSDRLQASLKVTQELTEQLKMAKRRGEFECSQSKSHKRVYLENASNIIRAKTSQVLGPIEDRTITTTVQGLWEAWPSALVAPVASDEAPHQNFLEDVLAHLIPALGTKTQLRFKPKPHFGSDIPDLGLFANDDLTNTWQSILVLIEVERARNQDDASHYNQGMGQALSYTSEKLKHDVEAQHSTIGVFTTSWHIEIFRRAVATTSILSTKLLPFLPNPKPAVATAGFTDCPPVVAVTYATRSQQPLPYLSTTISWWGPPSWGAVGCWRLQQCVHGHHL